MIMLQDVGWNTFIICIIYILFIVACGYVVSIIGKDVERIESIAQAKFERYKKQYEEDQNGR